MYEQESISSINSSQNTNDTSLGEPLPEPRFLDAETLEHAKPAMPLSEVRAKRSKPLFLILLAVLAGLTGGIIGSLIFHALRKPAPANATTSTGSNQSSEQIAQRARSEVAQSSSSNDEHSEAVGAQSAANDEEANSQISANAVSNPARETSDAEALRNALNEWIAATNARDIERQMSFYNPIVSAFYLTRNVTASDVRAEKIRVLGRVNSVDIHTGRPLIRISPDRHTATMRFIKSYQIDADGQRRRGEVLQELRWQRVNGNWKIISERDLKVLEAA